VNVFFSDEQDEPVDGDALRALALYVLEAERLPGETEMSLILVGPEQMAGYNEQFMDRPGPTDVLAFPLAELVPGHPPLRVANDPPVALGDIFLCPVVIARRIVAEGWSADYYDIYRLVVHGMLHLLGYDHHVPTGADLMEQREDELLSGNERGSL